MIIEDKESNKDQKDNAAGVSCDGRSEGVSKVENGGSEDRIFMKLFCFKNLNSYLFPMNTIPISS